MFAFECAEMSPEEQEVGLNKYDQQQRLPTKKSLSLTSEVEYDKYDNKMTTPPFGGEESRDPADAIVSRSFAETTPSPQQQGANKLISFADDVKTATEDPSMTISTLEVNYDVQPTDLYTLIEKRQWDRALNLLSPSNANSRDATIQAWTWVVRKDSGANTDKIRWRLLPLHAAIIFCGPLDLIVALLKVYPGAALCKDDQGMLPLHLAFRNDASDEIIDEILGVYPEAIHVQDRKGREPLTCAMGGNCGKKGRAKLIASYSSIAMEAERDRIVEGIVEEEAAKHVAEIEELKATHEKSFEELKATYEKSLIGKLVKHQAEVAEMKSTHETSLIDKITTIGQYQEEAKMAEAVKKDLEESVAIQTIKTASVKKELEDSIAREAILTDKVQDLTNALEALTNMRQAETQRHNDESTQLSRASKDLRDKITDLEKEKNSIDNELKSTKEQKVKEAAEKDLLRLSMDDIVQSHRRLQAKITDLEKEKNSIDNELKSTKEQMVKEAAQKDLLRLSMDDIVQSHRRLQAEWDVLADRNDILEGLLERSVAERDGMHSLLAKLDLDMSAAQTLRERMTERLVAAIAQQENEVYSLATREHEIMRGILERQRAEMDTALRGAKANEAELEAIDQGAAQPSYPIISAREQSRGSRSSPALLGHIRHTSNGDLSALGLGGAEDARGTNTSLSIPPRPSRRRIDSR